jgi:polyphosphate kinase 2 (PPK2 family)
MLDSVDLSQSLDRETYVREIALYQLQLQELSHQIRVQDRPAMVVFEGPDSISADDLILRVTETLDPRTCIVHPVDDPDGVDLAHHHLYRFWRRLPPRRTIGVFDGSWYRERLVSRVAGRLSDDDWARALREINSFERQVADFGTIVVKFWLHASLGEHLQQNEHEEGVLYQVWEFPSAVWRSPERREAYQEAVNEMLFKTSTLSGAWTIVESDDSWWAEVKTLSTLVETLSWALNYQPRALRIDPEKVNQEAAASKKAKEGKKKKKKKGKK